MSAFTSTIDASNLLAVELTSAARSLGHSQAVQIQPCCSSSRRGGAPTNAAQTFPMPAVPRCVKRCHANAEPTNKQTRQGQGALNNEPMFPSPHHAFTALISVRRRSTSPACSCSTPARTRATSFATAASTCSLISSGTAARYASRSAARLASSTCRSPCQSDESVNAVLRNQGHIPVC